MIDHIHLRKYVVRPALEAIGLWSKDAERLVMGTAAQESHLRYLHQLGDGPALGLWQMEPATYRDIWESYLDYRHELATLVKQAGGYATTADRPPESALIYNLRLGAAMCRIHYRRVPEALPSTVEGMASYWKRRYNTSLGAGKESEFVENFKIVED